jgi:hypothetical protein
MCVVFGEGFLDVIAALGDFSATDAVAGGALALGGADAAGAFGGADATSAGLDTSGVQAGAGDLNASLADTPGGLAQTQDLSGVSGGAGQTTSSIAPSAGGDIQGLTVTAPSTAGGGSLGAALDQVGPAIAPIAASGLAASGAGGGGSGVPGQAGIQGPESAAPLSDSGPLTASNASPGVSDIGQTLDSGGGGFLPATGDSSVQALSPDVMQSLGIDQTGTFTGENAVDLASGTPSASDISGLTSGAGDISPGAIDAGATPGMPDVAPESLGERAGDIGQWIKNPKNAATAGMLGLSLKNALSQPKLPGASAAAEANAAAVGKSALPVIQSGGTATPEWASQKASIDATIDNQIKQQTQALMQAAASSGEGGANSGIVQQQIAQMTQQANLQREQLYAQAQAQNVQAAVSELSGGDSTLAAIGQMQANQSEQAQQLAAQTAALALQLQTGQRWPGQGGGTGVPTGP